MTDENNFAKNEEIMEAMKFYSHLVLDERLVFDTDIDIIPSEYVQDTEKCVALSMGNMISREILKEFNIDAFEIVQFFEMELLKSIHTGTDAREQGSVNLFITNIQDIESETQETKRQRRLTHLVHCAKEVGEFILGDKFIMDMDSGSMGFPDDSPAYFKFYMEAVMERFGEDAKLMQSVVDGDADKKEILKNHVEKRKSELRFENDPDHEDNDDDPFGMFV